MTLTVELWSEAELRGVPDRRTAHHSTPRVPFPPLLVRNVTQPRMSVHLPDPATATGTAVIVCPGGALHFLSVAPEGTDVADWLNTRGIAAFVLEYRLAPTSDDPAEFESHMLRLFTGGDDLGDLKAPHEAAAIADGLRAVELVRMRASEWGIDPTRIGILGFSAGGFVAAHTALAGVGVTRPDFAAAIYAALWEPFVAPAQPMPLFVAVANNDQMGELMTSTAVRLHQAWSAADAPVELHIYQSGGHGFGMRSSGAPSDSWIDHFHTWLQFNLATGQIGRVHP
jgi:acetyl esterase/lipase